MKIVQKVELASGRVVEGVPIDVSDGASNMDEVRQQMMSAMSEQDLRQHIAATRKPGTFDPTAVTR